MNALASMRRALPFLTLLLLAVCADADPPAVTRQIRACSVTVETLTRSDKESVPHWGSGTLFVDCEGTVYVLTAAHVIGKAHLIKAVQYKVGDRGLLRGCSSEGELLAQDAKQDLAIVRLGKDLFPYPVTGAKLGPDAQDDDPVIHCGSYTGDYHQSVSRGHVSTAGRAWEGITWTQTDLTMIGGSSGGGVFNLRGELVGVPCQLVKGTTRIGFCAPASRVRRWAAKVGLAHVFDPSLPVPEE